MSHGAAVTVVLVVAVLIAFFLNERGRRKSAELSVFWHDRARGNAVAARDELDRELAEALGVAKRSQTAGERAAALALKWKGMHDEERDLREGAQKGVFALEKATGAFVRDALLMRGYLIEKHGQYSEEAATLEGIFGDTVDAVEYLGVSVPDMLEEADSDLVDLFESMDRVGAEPVGFLDPASPEFGPRVIVLPDGVVADLQAMGAEAEARA